jgi:hypothetical protein
MSAVAGASQEPIASPVASRKASNGTAPDKEKEKEKRYKCQFCNRAFSRSEHRSRHERSRKCSLQASQPCHHEAGSSSPRAVAWWAGGARGISHPSTVITNSLRRHQRTSLQMHEVS